MLAHRAGVKAAGLRGGQVRAGLAGLVLGRGRAWLERGHGQGGVVALGGQGLAEQLLLQRERRCGGHKRGVWEGRVGGGCCARGLAGPRWAVLILCRGAWGPAHAAHSAALICGELPSLAWGWGRLICGTCARSVHSTCAATSIHSSSAAAFFKEGGRGVGWVGAGLQRCVGAGAAVGFALEGHGKVTCQGREAAAQPAQCAVVLHLRRMHTRGAM